MKNCLNCHFNEFQTTSHDKENGRSTWCFTILILIAYYPALTQLEFIFSVKKPFFKNALIIHEENTKKNHKRVVSLYVIEISLDLHKL
jgi:hypothetical protein